VANIASLDHGRKVGCSQSGGGGVLNVPGQSQRRKKMSLLQKKKGEGQTGRLKVRKESVAWSKQGKLS